MSGPPPPPPPPSPQPYRIITYPNYFVGTLTHGQAITIVPNQGEQLQGTLMDITPYGLTLWNPGQMVHVRWDAVRRLEWEPPS